MFDQPLLILLSIASGFLPLIAVAFFLKKVDKALKLLSAFLILSQISEFICLYLSSKRTNNMPVFHWMTFLEISIIWYVSHTVMPLHRKKLLVVNGIALLFCLINPILFQTIWEFNSIPRISLCYIAIVTVIVFFYSTFKADETMDILAYPYFWLYTGWLVYFAGNLFLFTYYDITKINDLTFPYIHSVLNILLNLAYTYALWLGSRKWTSR